MQDIKKLLPNIKKNVPLAHYTTFRIGGPARYFYVAKSGDDLITAVDAARKCGIPIFILGAGSNLLVSDKGFKGLVIKIQNQNAKIKNTNQKSKIIETAAGSLLAQIVSLATENGLTGFEWAGGIPGTVGGAVRGNAGAFGSSMADVTKTVSVLEIKNQDAKIKNYDNKDCKFGYRNSVFKHNSNLIILSAELQLKKKDKSEVQQKMREYLEYRRAHHPLKYPSAGSIFKNQKLDIPMGPSPRAMGKNQKLFKQFPDLRQFEARGDIPAAYLISECGLKGEKVGGAMVSDEHPNFIINIGNAKAQDVSELIKLIKKKVKNKFGIALEEEIQYVGF